jgi:hypothetical protein
LITGIIAGRMLGALPLHAKVELRAMTKKPRDFDKAVMMPSAIPSPKYSCSGSPLMFWNGRTAIDGLAGRRGLSSPTGYCRLHKPQPKGVDRLCDVLQRLLTHIFEGKVDSSRDIFLHACRHANPAGFGNAFQPRGDVDAITENVAVLFHDVPDIDADAESYAPVLGLAGVAASHMSLHFNRAAYGVNDARALSQQSVTCDFDNAAAVPHDARI